MNYNEYKVEDFVQDISFQQWTLKNDVEAMAFWEKWRNENPDKNNEIEQAQAIVKGLKIKEIPILEQDIQQGIQRIMNAIEAPQTPIIPMHRRQWLRIVASLLLICVLGFLWTKRDSIASNKVAYTEIINNENKTLSVVLPDGSTVVLEKNSKIAYIKDFAQPIREVKLTGQALFDVVKNPEKPFVVHTGNLITKVLGTSFIIKSFDNEGSIAVDVLRGKVSVSMESRDTQKLPNSQTEVILLPNQKAVFSKKEETINHTLVENPIAVVTSETLKDFVFDEAPISEIFRAMEKVYGIKVLYNEADMRNCIVTTTLGNEPLFDNLTVICKSIGATYSIKNTEVIVKGTDCN